jgi:hypothetical protein
MSGSHDSRLPTPAPEALLALIEKRTEPPAAPSPARTTASKEDTPYGRAALRAECDELAATPERQRNDKLNRAAFSTGQLYAGGELQDLSLIERNLTEAASTAGLGASEIPRTIRSGIGAGLNHPRSAPERRQSARVGGPRLNAFGTDAEEVDLDYIVRAAVRGDTFLAEEIKCPPSVIGNGLLLAGDCGIIYGKPGRNKSWLLSVLTACGLGGRDWLGLAVARVRIGLISLEGHDFFLQQRLEIALREIYGPDAEAPELLKQLSVITRRKLGQRLGLLEDSAAIRRWIDDEGLDLVIPDPLSKLHRGKETAEELGPVIEEAEDLAAGGSRLTAFLIAHHERKPPGGSRGGEDDDLDALRGTTRLSTDPRLLIRVKTHPADPTIRVITFPKVSYAKPPEAIYVQIRAEDGYPMLTSKPATERECDKRREAIRKALIEAGPEGCTRAELETVAGLKERATLNHLAALGAIKGIEDGPRTRWHLPDPPLEAGAETVSIDLAGTGDEALRERILECLKNAGPGGLTRAEIVPQVGSPSPATVWRHLTWLEQQGFATEEGEKGKETWRALPDNPGELDL